MLILFFCVRETLVRPTPVFTHFASMLRPVSQPARDFIKHIAGIANADIELIEIGNSYHLFQVRQY